MENWVTGVIFALFIIIPCWLALSRREEPIRQVEAWPGSPREYIQGVVDLVIQSNPRLLARMMRSFPSIELKGDNLTCWQNGELTNVEDQIALLDLLCSMAELAEKDPTEVPQEEIYND